ncbi:hypothetical protein HPB47_020337 [Ixodes persulcatus]|uniref:Uncharacterized protein n=1 Tax=Ixodes persulcatus TaxID=34615 RepID=A0AC60QFN4_IXOPE|nr:hypothetical protein HPB47_020337 [Ixodes persulcatus]
MAEAGPSSGQDIPSVEMEELPMGTSSASSTISYCESICDDPSDDSDPYNLAYEPFPRESTIGVVYGVPSDINDTELQSHVAHPAGDHMNAPAAMLTTPSARTAAKLMTRHLIFVRHIEENKRYTSTRAKLKLAMHQRNRRDSRVERWGETDSARRAESLMYSQRQFDLRQRERWRSRQNAACGAAVAAAFWERDSADWRRPRSRTRQEDDRIASASFDQPSITAAKIRGQLDLQVSLQTIRRRLHVAGLRGRIACQKPLLTSRHKEQRLAFSEAHRDWDASDWASAIFTHESTFTSEWDQQKRVWRPTCKRLLDGLGVRQLTWPARSPDPNVIENIWGLMKRNLLTRDLHQASSENLWEAVEQE